MNEIEYKLIKFNQLTKFSTMLRAFYLKSFEVLVYHKFSIFEISHMKKDIQQPEVKDIIVAVVHEENEEADPIWMVYILNAKSVAISDVLISSTGYGNLDGEETRTSVLRHFIDKIPAQGFAKIEPIMEDVFGLSNEYWVSFYIDGVIYDKKFIFLPETIKIDYFTTIPLINKKGVMIK